MVRVVVDDVPATMELQQEVVDSSNANQIPPVGLSRSRMCPNGNTPLLLERSDSYLDSEVNSDVTFFVGQGSELSRVPGHSSVLAAASPVFHKMFCGPLRDGPVITIPDVDRRAFDNLLRYVYGEEVQLLSVATALTTLYAAHKYECEGLERLCLLYLSSKVDTSCVLDVFHDMLYYTATRQQNWAPSAPPIEAEQANEPIVPVLTNESNTINLYMALLNKCLWFIDYHADIVLQQEQLEDLNADELCMIARRDTLGISSEMILFNALERWCYCRCKCNQWELSPEKRRIALGNDLLFSVRFLLMTSEEFMSEPMNSKLLNQEEAKFLLEHFLKHKNIQCPSMYLEEVLSSLKRPRQKPRPPTSDPGLEMSRRSSKTPSSRDSFSSRSSKSAKKQLKKQRRQTDVEQRNVQERKPNFTDMLFSCIACVFD